MDKFRCLTCYIALTEVEYVIHKQLGHVTIEYIEYNSPHELTGDETSYWQEYGDYLNSKED